jgi:hypothetical protein
VRGRERHRIIRALHAYPHTASALPFGDELHYSDAREELPAAHIAAELQAYLQLQGFVDAAVAPIAPGI